MSKSVHEKQLFSTEREKINTTSNKTEIFGLEKKY